MICAFFGLGRLHRHRACARGWPLAAGEASPDGQRLRRAAHSNQPLIACRLKREHAE